MAAPPAVRFVRFGVDAVSRATGFVFVAFVPALTAVFRVVFEVRARVVTDPMVQHRAVTGAIDAVLFRSALVVALAAMVCVGFQKYAFATARCPLFLDTRALGVNTAL